MRSLKVCCRASADVCFKHFWRYLKKLSHFHSDWCPCALDLPCFPPAWPSVLSCSSQGHKVPRLPSAVPKLIEEALHVYIFFFVSTCYPHILTYCAMNTKHDAQQLGASSVRDDLLYGCCLHAALCVHLSHLCSGAPPLSPGNYFTSCFHLSPSGRKRLPLVIASAKWAFRHSASHYLVKPSALKMLIIW